MDDSPSRHSTEKTHDSESRATVFRQSLVVCALLIPTTLYARDDSPLTATLASDGKALLPIVVAEGANERIRAAAETLATYLERITGAKFEISAGDGRKGIAVGLPGEFPKLPGSDRWANPKLTEREDYMIRTHAEGVNLLGATPLAVEHAVWDLLHRVGYRQFFPGEHWEIVPRQRNLSVTLEVSASPDFHARRIWYGYGPWDYAREPYARWCARNRATSGLALNTGHSYGGIIRANQAEFDKHPEYYALVAGKRNIHPQAKLCIGNAALRKLVVQHALRKFEREPSADSISMDPSDGGGWCECDACGKLGGVSDRALLLANQVAEAVNARHPGKLVGMYAYAHHSPPPAQRVHPQVVISVATAFIKGGFSLDELIAGWSGQGATLGIREYYSVHTWDRDMPGRARGTRLDYLKRTIPEFHRRGARFMSAESSDNWGPNGLGYYLAARMLWDVEEAQRVDELVEDFLTRSFGPAKEPMRQFYRQLDGSTTHLVLDDQLGRMFRALAAAQKLADSPEIRRRLDDLILYARYVDLFDRYQAAKGGARQAAFEQHIKHGYRMRRTMLIHAKALYRDVVARDKTVSIPAEARWGVPEDRNPWKSSQPFAESELAAFLDEGIRGRPLVELGFEPVSFSESLVPARELQLKDVPPGGVARGRGMQTFYHCVEEAPSKIALTITGGLIAHYRDRGNVRVKLWRIESGQAAEGKPAEGSKAEPAESLVAHDRSVPPDGKPRVVTLTAKQPGLYKITVSDGGDMTSVAWPARVPICFKSSLAAPIKTSGRWSLYFYVPRGTKVLGLFGGSTGEIRDPEGKPVFSLVGRKAGYYSVPVAPGTDGQLWKIHHAAGSIRLVNVPPYLARSAAELLLPREVIEADRAR